MWFWAFIWIIVAVALGVYYWLKMYNNPEWFKNDLSTIWALIELLLIFVVIVVLIGWVIFTIIYLINNGIPQWVDGALQVIWYIFTVVLGLWLVCFIIRSIIHKIKEEWWIKKRWKNHKPKKEAVKKWAKQASLWCLKYTWIIILGTVVFLWLLALLWFFFLG